MISYNTLRKKHFLPWHDTYETMNNWGKSHVPFVFLISFDGREVHAWDVDKLPPEIQIDFPTFSKKRGGNPNTNSLPSCTLASPLSFDIYASSFLEVMTEIQYGNSYLLNLCGASEIRLEGSLEDVFHHVNAPYKFLWNSKFVFFSPEPFIHIVNNEISTFPMKGTSTGDGFDSLKQLELDEKELGEHYTVVDLLRNDLGMIARKVNVKRFRYFEKIQTPQAGFWQASSHISGNLDADWRSRIGTILYILCPAGSISGAPKKKTCNIIHNVESIPRKFYTGITGVYDGNNVYSTVNIRFIEKFKEKYYFRSGGGITQHSLVNKEYEELIRKIQLPMR